MKNIIIVLLWVLCVSGCANRHLHADELIPNEHIFTNKELDTIELSGNNLHVKLVQNNKPLVVPAGQKTVLHDIEINEYDDKLTITSTSDNSGLAHLEINIQNIKHLIINGDGIINSNTNKPLTMEINTNNKLHVNGKINLISLVLTGNGSVKFDKLSSSNLKLNISDQIVAELGGEIALTELVLSDCAWLDLYWNNSSYLKVIAKDKAFATVGGKVEKLDVDIIEQAHFNGRFLQAKIANIETKDIARADVNIIELAYLMAAGKSNIYNYAHTMIQHEKVSIGSSILTS